MIGYIKGKILNLEINNILILLDSGIAYEIIINEIIYNKLLNKNEAELFIYHSINENNQSLFGFSSIEEKNIFKELIKISGIGGKVAINIMSLGLNTFIEAIINEDNKKIEEVKGVGKKMASKIILEFKDKDLIKNYNFNSKQKEIKNKTIEKNTKQQVLESLINMGYNKKNIEEVLQKLPENINTLENIIPFVIKNIK